MLNSKNSFTFILSLAVCVYLVYSIYPHLSFELDNIFDNTIVVGYYGFTLDVHVSVRVNIQGLGAILDIIMRYVQVYSI